jgi:type II secretory pathway component PulC
MNTIGYPIDLFRGAWVRHSIMLVLLVCVSVLAWSVFESFKPNITNPYLQAAPHDLAMDVHASSERIAKSHLFGQNVSLMVNTPSTSAANISVQGLIYSEDKDSALAILNMDGASAFFRIGDTLPDGETLLAIAPTAVELGNGAATRVIELQRASAAGGAGIILAGDAGLIGQNRTLFPGETGTASQGVYTPALRAVSIPSNADPLTQLQALRQQLIKH